MSESESPPPAPFYEGATYTPENSVGYLLRRVMQGMIDEIGARLDPIGLTYAQWTPLMLLYTGRASTVAELAREHLTDPGATTRLLDRLEAKGLCRRVRSEVDRRVVNVELTPEGREVASRIPEVLERGDERAARGVQPRGVDGAEGAAGADDPQRRGDALVPVSVIPRRRDPAPAAPARHRRPPVPGRQPCTTSTGLSKR